MTGKGRGTVKQIAAFLLAFVLAFSLTACGSRAVTRPQTERETSVPQETAESGAESNSTADSGAENNGIADSGADSEDAEPELAAASAHAQDGWYFDSTDGTLYLYEQKYVLKTPYTGDLSKVRTIVLSGSVTTVPDVPLEEGCFDVYPQLRKIVLDDSVQTLETAALDGCSKVERIYLGSGVREIADDAFFGSCYGEGCAGVSGLRTIAVSRDNPYFAAADNVLYNKAGTEIIHYPMHRQKTEYVIPDSVTDVRWFAFSCNQTMRKLTVGRGISDINFSLFSCVALRELILPDTLRSVGDGAIKYCALESVVIPDSVTYLGAEAFSRCDQLREIRIGKGVVLTDDRLWFNSPVLSKVTVDPDNPSLCVVDDVVFTKDRKTLLLYPAGLTDTEYRIPDGTKTVADAAFQGENLKKLYIPVSVKKIGADNLSYVLLDEEQEYQGIKYPYEIWYAGSAAQWKEITADIGNVGNMSVHFYAQDFR